MNSVEIEQVENGYVVTIQQPSKDESFFDSFEDVIAYLKFYFNVKED